MRGARGVNAAGVGVQRGPCTGFSIHSSPREPGSSAEFLRVQDWMPAFAGMSGVCCRQRQASHSSCVGLTRAHTLPLQGRASAAASPPPAQSAHPRASRDPPLNIGAR